MGLIVKLWGGPGSGKSTIAARVFSDLKMQGVNCELVTEFAKDLTWEKREKALGNQAYIFGKQWHRIERVYHDVDVIVTDSPPELTAFYGKPHQSEHFIPFVFDVARQYPGLDYFLSRLKKYNPVGRRQNEEEARELDRQILTFLTERKVNFKLLPGLLPSSDEITEEVLAFLSSPAGITFTDARNLVDQFKQIK